MKSYEFLHSVDVANALGEGVLWNERTRTAWWTDIERSRLYEYDPVGNELSCRDMPLRVACFGFVEGAADLVVAFDRGIAVYSPDNATVDWLVPPGSLAEGVRFNDGKVDSHGRFWVGTMVEDPAVPAGSAALYCYEPGTGLVEHVGGVTISNGLCWSPDGSVMYFADSPVNTITAYRFDAVSGVLSAPRLFARTLNGVHPDGSTVDAEGGLWNAQWGAGQVVRYTADGDMDLAIEVPASQPTCVTFGGAGLDLLFVTTARVGLGAEELVAQPEAGNLFVYRTGFTGLPASRFGVAA